MIETKQYEAYKDSGIEWVGIIPMGWQTRPLFAVVRANTESNKAGAESNLLSLSYGRIIRKDITANDGLLPASFDTYQVIRQNDIVLRLTDLQNDKRSLRSAISPERGIITSAYLAVTPTCVLPNYLSYLLRAYDLQKVFYSMGGGLRQSMKYSDMKWLPVILPPESTQRAIVDFLDRETAHIDDLIGKQEHLIELLAEKRQATITNAVTKGLAPTVRTEPSGVPWLGEVAAHWAIVELKHVVEVLTGFPFKSEDFTEDPDDVPLLRGANVNPGQTNWVDTVRFSRHMSDEYSDYLLRSGDLVLGLDRPIVSKGTRVCSIEEQDLPALLLQRVARIRTNDKADQEFVGHVLSSSIFSSYLEPLFTGVSVPHMSPGQLREFKISLPPLHEQEQIARSLRRSLKKLDVLVDRSRGAIALLRERRSALISAAVTGQIDVREGAA